MIEEVQKLLVKSQALSPDEKKKYLWIVKFMEEKDLIELKTILQNEEKSAEEIKKAMEIEESEYNKNAIKEIGEIYGNEYKKSVSKAEEEEKESAEKILDQLNEQ